MNLKGNIFLFQIVEPSAENCPFFLINQNELFF